MTQTALICLVHCSNLLHVSIHYDYHMKLHTRGVKCEGGRSNKGVIRAFFFMEVAWGLLYYIGDQGRVS